MKSRVRCTIRNEYRGKMQIEAELLESNAKTVWVKLPGGDIIKRHRKKHNVETTED